jgi:hypothetical protein
LKLIQNSTKSDVKTYIDANKLQPKVNLVESFKVEKPKPTIESPPSPSADYIDIELTNMRKVIAKRLVLSKVRKIS